MAKHYASGNWKVSAGKEDAFIETWTKFLHWTREAHPGLGTARLLRDEADRQHFQSFSDWSDEKARESWRSDPKFAEMIGACRALCDDLHTNDYEEIASN